MSAEPTFTHCPKCHTELLDAPGIGQFCPNKACDVADGILVAAGLAPPFVIRQPDRAESAVAVMRAAALLRSLGWSVVAPVDPPSLGTRELDALAEAAHWCDRAYWWRQASMRKLAAHGLVERHPDSPGTDARPAWRITKAGMARYSGAAP